MKKDRIDHYYGTNAYSKPCSYLLYLMTAQLNKQTVETFWLWVLGLTDQVVHSKISFFQYDEWLQDCQKELLTLSNQILEQENDSLINNKIEETGDENQKLLYSKVDLETENFKVGSILPQQEFRFMFLRSWTLYNSAFYSNYIASKLKLYQDGSKNGLLQFFALMGIPSDEYNQQYKFMSYKYKTILREKLPEVAKKCNLENLLFSSFVRQIDNKTQVSASDMVYAVTSLIESYRPVMVDDIPDTETAKTDNEENIEVDKAFELTHDTQIENFWAAFDSLDIKNKNHVHYGIKLAKELQIALVNTASSLISNKWIKPALKFRYSVIKNDSLVETKMFQYPLAIQKLALFVSEASTEARKNKEPLPFVLFIKNSQRNTYLVAGVLGQQHMVTDSSNEFGTYFERAAELVNASYKQDSFET